jgi:hypothetical protein
MTPLEDARSLAGRYTAGTLNDTGQAICVECGETLPDHKERCRWQALTRIGDALDAAGRVVDGHERQLSDLEMTRRLNALAKALQNDAPVVAIPYEEQAVPEDAPEPRVVRFYVKSGALRADLSDNTTMTYDAERESWAKEGEG